MREKQYKVVIGGLLHDIGKVLYRSGDGLNHAESGYEFLKERTELQDDDILKQIRFHHVAGLKQARLPADSLAYITYIADNIAAAADRRKADEQGYGFVRELPLNSIFNLLNGNDEHQNYSPMFLTEEINYPTTRVIQYSESFYKKCIENIRSCISGIIFQESYVNSLLEILEANLTYIPSSTSKQEVADISLFDHSKITAAIGSCILEYLEAQGIQDYHAELFRGASEFYKKKVFLLYSIDISGIQDFIYTISSDKALKTLRSRSFYLEILMEHLVDTLLSSVDLSRANCIYCGGGHAYLLLSNTEETQKSIKRFEDETNEWFLKTFGTSLYIAGGYVPCSANDIKNEPEGSYKELFTTISSRISSRKLNRYTARQILGLNTAAHVNTMRECAVCHRADLLGEEDKCSICAGFEAFSRAIQKEAFFAVTKTESQGRILPLPGDCFLVAETEEGLKRRMKEDEGYQRSYSKNKLYTGQGIATKLWVGDYQNGDSFQELAQSSSGIRRLAVLRADVDNLGQAFVRGFENQKYGQRYVTLSRTATFSRKLSLFFKRHVNQLLEDGGYCLTEDEPHARRATIVYSGGDDMFVIGAWDDVIGFALDLNDALNEYSQGTLTLSAGIGIYPEKYPVASLARETGKLEDAAKAYPGKNAVSLFSKENTYSWSDFENYVIEEKYTLIREFFQSTADYGKSFLYNLLELMRNRDEKINLARYAYLLARMEPNIGPYDEATEEEKVKYDLYREFSQKMYAWMRDEEECRQAITAVYIYIYTIRESEEGNSNENQ